MVPNIVPPKNPKFEEIVLSGLLHYEDLADEVIELFGGREVFYETEYSYIYQKIFELYHAGHGVSVQAIVRKMHADGMSRADMAEYMITLNKLNESRYDHRELMVTAEELLELQQKRESVIEALGLLDGIERGLPLEDIRLFADRLRDTTETANNFRITSIGDACNDVLRRMEIAMAATTELTGIPSGLASIDKFTGGFQETDVIGLMGATGQGKTAVAAILTHEAAKMGFPSAYVSLEMPGFSLTRRMIARETAIAYRDIRDAKKLSFDQVKAVHLAIGRIEKLPIYYYDEGPRDFRANIRPWLRMMVRKHGVKFIVIDYMQLMRLGKISAIYERVTNLSAELKELQTELKVPIVALLQMNRDAAKRSTAAKPELSDIRDSGQIEQDLSVCIGCYLPDYYNFRESQRNGTHYVATREMELIILKNREGAIGTNGANYCEIENNIITDPRPNFWAPEVKQIVAPRSVELPRPKVITNLFED